MPRVLPWRALVMSSLTQATARVSDWLGALVIPGAWSASWSVRRPAPLGIFGLVGRLWGSVCFFFWCLRRLVSPKQVGLHELLAALSVFRKDLSRCRPAPRRPGAWRVFVAGGRPRGAILVATGLRAHAVSVLSSFLGEGGHARRSAALRGVKRDAARVVSRVLVGIRLSGGFWIPVSALAEDIGNIPVRRILLGAARFVVRGAAELPPVGVSYVPRRFVRRFLHLAARALVEALGNALLAFCALRVFFRRAALASPALARPASLLVLSVSRAAVIALPSVGFFVAQALR